MLLPMLGYFYTDEIYVAGDRAPAGTYREIGTERVIQLPQMMLLPTSKEGYMTAYVCVRHAWNQER